MCRNPFRVENHINNTIDPSIEPQSGRLMGNIATWLAGNGDIYYTEPLLNSILGKGNGHVPDDKLIISNNSTAVNSAGLQADIPRHFFDRSPLHDGDLGIGISWSHLKNNPGYIYANDGTRTLNINTVSDLHRDPRLKQIISNGKKTVASMSVNEQPTSLHIPGNSFEN